ncbi:hypothetical protein Solca_0947 [Solitalea canadensis DSM 3403]|uniref:Uncharacterized protein n=1 Tax=Solitalea canadensis (strain ATCC 29591 / DSM 3403 / JCM 21819 / LMG 8368 / NBRC 15130 / NCIMB 12057 / USAM 9D) TaxID=929556 RepID=H8KV59_SOLCM|nr:hypothetical protein Solca_0947 [Solitalea canadensis DSM 3403]
MPIDPFKFSETLVKSSFNRYQQSLLITSTGANKSSNLIILLRLMSGGVKFRSINDSNYIRQDIDYLDLNNQFTAVSPLKK